VVTTACSEPRCPPSHVQRRKICRRCPDGTEAIKGRCVDEAGVVVVSTSADGGGSPPEGEGDEEERRTRTAESRMGATLSQVNAKAARSLRTAIPMLRAMQKCALSPTPRSASTLRQRLTLCQCRTLCQPKRTLERAAAAVRTAGASRGGYCLMLSIPVGQPASRSRASLLETGAASPEPQRRPIAASTKD
jgi:hypothetical protein